jgi:O-antigen/teichoic acid export membrane protein
MSEIRRQSIISTLFVYIGFIVGFVNTYLFTRQGVFTESQYGITQIFIAVGNIMFAFANLGMISTVYKFYPYYNDNLPKKKNDLLSWALLISIIGFIVVVVVGILLKDLVIRKFSERAPDFVKYYFWVFPFGFSIVLYSVFEVFAWNIRKSILTTFLREILFRVLITVLIFLFAFKLINNFDIFVKFYSLSYGIVALSLLMYLIYKKEFYLTFSVSKVTRRLYNKMKAFATFIYFGSVVVMIAQYIETLVILSLLGTPAAGIYALGNVVAGLVQAPQRGAVAASIPVLSKAWKDKDHTKIRLIYQRSGINLLIASLGIFLLVWLNYTDAIKTFHLREAYLNSVWIFFFVGLAKIVDLGTGVNSTIIGTSSYWKFELTSGIILAALAIPLNYILVKRYGIIGAGYSHLIAFTVYNTIRIIFLQRKFDMHPFTIKSLYSIMLAIICYAITYFVFVNFHGFLGIILKSFLFISLFAFSILYFNLSPDMIPILSVIKRKVGMERKRK